MFPRKLFPNLTAAPVNETNCSEVCGQTCTYSCYSYTDFSYFPPPPPALSPDPSYQISPYLVIGVILVAAFALLASFYAIVARYCSNRSRPAPARSAVASEGDDFHDIDDGEDDDDHDPVLENPIWFITTVGLQQSIINSIAVVRYKRGDGLIDGTDCSVCLSEFQEDETLRLLPKCNHAFHIGCIDTWLRSHTNCPLCRASIASNPGRPSVASNDPSSGYSRGTDPAQVGDLDTVDIESARFYSSSTDVADENRIQGGRDSESKSDMSLDGHQNQLLRRSTSMDHTRGIGNSRFFSLELRVSSHEPGEGRYERYPLSAPDTPRLVLSMQR